MGNGVRKWVSLGMAMTVVVGGLTVTGATNKVQAWPNEVELSSWTFFQGGLANETDGTEENRNCGFIDSVIMNNSGEEITGWKKEESFSSRQSQTAASKSSGFQLNIADTGWDCDWGNPYLGHPEDRINPWSVQAQMNQVPIKKDHEYTVSFKAKASSYKYAYVDFWSEVNGATINTYGNQKPIGENSQVIVIAPIEREFSYRFTNWVGAEAFSTNIMLGAFSAQYDPDGRDISDIITKFEYQWSGTVEIKDFKIIDEGKWAPAPTTTEEKTTKNVTETTSTVLETTTKSNSKPEEEFKKKCGVTKIQSAVKKKSVKKVKIKLKKHLKLADGYEVRFYRTNKDAKKNKKALVKVFVKKNNTKFTVSHGKLKKMQRLFTRIRGYKEIDKKMVFSNQWSAVKKVTIK